MRCGAGRFACGVLFCAALAGCQKPAATSAGDQEKAIRETVAEFQAALKARDGEKLWSLLDHDSQADAERAAKAARESYAKADAAQKAEQEKNLGLPGADLASLTGVGYLKTELFRENYDELADSTIDKVTPQGDEATVAYTEPDLDKKKLTLARQDGRWKLSLQIPMPKGAQP
jgi:hypothetical protein